VMMKTLQDIAPPQSQYFVILRPARRKYVSAPSHNIAIGKIGPLFREQMAALFVGHSIQRRFLVQESGHSLRPIPPPHPPQHKAQDHDMRI
jgi:hypothetical protein